MCIQESTLKLKEARWRCVVRTQAVRTETCLLMLENLKLPTLFSCFCFQIMHFLLPKLKHPCTDNADFLCRFSSIVFYVSYVSPKEKLDFSSTFTSNSIWLLLTLCSSCSPLHPFTMRPTGPYSKQARCLGGTASFPPSLLYFLTGLKQRGPLSGKRLPERALVSFSSGSELIPRWLGNQRGEKVGHCEASVLMKTQRSNLSRYQVYLSSRRCTVIRILTTTWVMLELRIIPHSIFQNIKPVLKACFDRIYETNTEAL